MDQPPIAYNKPLLFWSVLRTPQSFVGRAKKAPKQDIALALAILTQGRIAEQYKGWAECLLCGIKLGSNDLAAFGFVWPEKAEHYIEKHGVWTPGLDDFVKAIRSAYIGQLNRRKP